MLQSSSDQIPQEVLVFGPKLPGVGFFGHLKLQETTLFDEFFIWDFSIFSLKTGWIFPDFRQARSDEMNWRSTNGRLPRTISAPVPQYLGEAKGMPRVGRFLWEETT